MLGFSKFSVPSSTPSVTAKNFMWLGEKKNPHKRQITRSEHIKGYIF